MIPRLSITPLTRKRWRQFRKNRRAWGSLVALAALYAISLCSELLCNDQPLHLRIDNRSYFPFLRYVSQAELLGNGIEARPDYNALRQDPTFTRNPANRLLRAPVPFGPHQVTEPATLTAYRRATLTITPAVSIGRLNLAPDGHLSRPVGCAPFFAGAESLEGANFTNYWRTSPALDQALAARFANRAAPALSATLDAVATNASGAPATHLLVALTDYAPREAPPATVRLALREPDTPSTAPFSIRFDRPGERLRILDRRAWHRISAESQPMLMAWAEASCTSRTGLAEITLPWEGREAGVSCRFDAVSWPHRPVTGHWLGIDAAGRDVLARILYGTRTALNFGLLLVAWAMLLGLVIGAVQGYFGGWVDLATQRVIEIWSALPFLYVMILLGAVLGRSFGLLLLCYGLFNWIGISYYMRAEFLRLRQRSFVEAARCQGLSAVRIILRHILPNALTPLITLMPFSLVGAIASITALDFLGFGLPPLTPSWGELLQQAQQNRTAWWLILYPSLMLFTVMLLTVFIGEGLRDAFDPKPKSQYH
jgi:microcin C transport system permease protein